MLNANHWFVACERGQELRISTLRAQNRVKASARHLCGHKCLHKLVDDFMAGTLSARASSAVETNASSTSNCSAPQTDAHLTWIASHQIQALPIIGSHVEEFES